MTLSSSSDSRHEQIKGMFFARLGIGLGIPIGAWAYGVGGAILALALFGAFFLVAVACALVDIYRWQKELDRG